MPDKNLLQYDKMVEEALRGVVRESLGVALGGLPGDHHFYVTFTPRHPGVTMPDDLRATYPEEMTIVLQHQFEHLIVKPDWFEVTLYFGGKGKRLHIPFTAITGFADPSAKFGLQFTAEIDALPPVLDESAKETPVVALPRNEAPKAGSEDSPPAGDDNRVVALDAFRKK